MSSDSPSFVERLDPRTKLLGVVILAAQIFLLNSVISLVAAATVVAVAALASRISFGLLIRRLRLVLWFAAIITAVHAFTMSGEPVLEFAGMFATREGFLTGAVLSARLVLMLWTSIVFVATTSIPAVMDGMETLAHPFRRRFGPVLMVMTLALNFVPSFVHTAQRIKKAQLARGADPESGFFRQVRYALSAALPLFATAFRSSEQLAFAMESRCYNPSRERSHLSSLKMGLRDWLVVTGLCCCLAGSVLLPS